MSNVTTSTCPTNALPEDENLGIDSDSIYAVVPRGNITSNDIPDEWMVSCCNPSPVRLASDNSTGTCWQWCDLPPKYTNWTSETSKMSDEFTTCITSSASYRNSSVQPNIFHVSAAARDDVAADGMAGLAVVLGLALWRLIM